MFSRISLCNQRVAPTTHHPPHFNGIIAVLLWVFVVGVGFFSFAYAGSAKAAEPKNAELEQQLEQLEKDLADLKNQLKGRQRKSLPKEKNPVGVGSATGNLSQFDVAGVKLGMGYKQAMAELAAYLKTNAAGLNLVGEPPNVECLTYNLGTNCVDAKNALHFSNPTPPVVGVFVAFNKGVVCGVEYRNAAPKSELDMRYLRAKYGTPFLDNAKYGSLSDKKSWCELPCSLELIFFPKDSLLKLQDLLKYPHC